MPTERLNATPAILPRVLAESLWGPRDLFVLDVGASGGIEWYWRAFGDRLRAIGFEPLVAEAERLQQLARGSKVGYEAAFVTCRHSGELLSPDPRNDRIRSKLNEPFVRVSALRAHELMRMNYVEQMFNAGASAEYADRHIVLGEYIPREEHEAVDFIKIDTDGHDVPVLLGADELFRHGGVLGLSVEVWFHGGSHDYVNTFADIDRFLRSRGLTLFDLDSYRYSRAALPAPFTYDIPAQTLTGQVMWGEAVYFRDLAMAEYDRVWGYQMTRERVLKLACLFDLFGLPDCAAELLLERRDLVGESSANALLNDLAAAEASTQVSYAEFIRRFEADPQAFYRSRRRTDAHAEPPPPAAAAQPDAARSEPPEAPPESGESESSEIRRLRKRVERQEEKIAHLQDRVRRRDERIEQLTRASASVGRGR